MAKQPERRGSIRSAAMWDWKMMGIMEVPDVLEHVTRASREAVGHLDLAARKFAVRRERLRLLLLRGYDVVAPDAAGPTGEPIFFLDEAVDSMARIDAAHNAAGIAFALSLRAHYDVGVDGDHPPYLPVWRTHRLAAFRRIALARERLRCATSCAVAAAQAVTLALGFYRRDAPDPVSGRQWALTFQRLAGHTVFEANQAAIQLTQLRRNVQMERNIAMAVLFNHTYLEPRVDVPGDQQQDAPGDDPPGSEQEDAPSDWEESYTADVLSSGSLLEEMKRFLG